MNDIKPEIEQSCENAQENAFPRMTNEALANFVMNYCDGKLLMSSNLPNRLLPLVFLPLMFALPQYNEATLKSIGLFWEYFDKAGPRFINGYPCFTTCHIMRSEDWERAKRAIKVEQDLRMDRRHNLFKEV